MIAAPQSQERHVTLITDDSDLIRPRPRGFMGVNKPSNRIALREMQRDMDALHARDGQLPRRQS